MKRLAFFALAIVAIGCSAGVDAPSSTGDEPVIAPNATDAQTNAFLKLQATTQRSWVWLQHDKYKTPKHLSGARVGKPLLVKGGDIAKTAVAFVDENKALFRMRRPENELLVEKTEVDEIGHSHARFRQVTHGVPVVGAQLAAHFDHEGRLTSVDANYIPDLDDLDVEPRFAQKDALQMVKADVLGRMPDVKEAQLEAPDGKLVVFALNDVRPTLAYEYTVRAIAGRDPAIWVVTVDAKTGEIVDRYNNLQTVQGSGRGALGQTKTFEVTESGNGFLMTDTSDGVTIRTTTASQQQDTPGTGITSSSADSWDTGVTGAGAAVDAHAHAIAVFKYYKNTHQRNAIDGNGSEMISTAHFGQAYDNAFWDGTGMSYGDGGELFKPLAAALDVCAHEFTHGVTNTTANLRYQGQSGALNEAVSDIFGVFIEHSVTPNDTTNWQMGELITLGSSSPMRDFKDPAAGDQPAHMNNFRNTTQDNGGVHINSGIINNAAYLMTAGGTNPSSKQEVKYGIGWEKSEKLWFRADTKYFLETTDFAGAAQGVLQAAKDVGLTENETNIVDCAFKATGVAQGACATLVDPKSTTPAPTTPGDSTSPGGGGSDSSDSTTSDSGDSSDESGTPTKSKKKRRPTLAQSSNGCNAAGGADFGPLAGLFLGLGLTAARRRRQSRES